MGSDLNKVEVSLTVAGQQCYVISLKLAQSFNSHHAFECVVDYEELDSKWMESPASVFGMLGQDVSIEMKHKDGKGTNTFNGVITQASYIGHHGSQNHIRISGCSPTIKLDGSKTMDSFMDMTLSGIVSEAVGTSGNGGSVTPQPKFSGKIDYIAQYDETCFEFLNRLSWIYGEWFFYDGEECYFGKKDGKSEEITFESEMTTFDLSANLLPAKMKRYHYLVHDDQEIDKEAPDPSTANYHSVAQGQSSSIYSSDAILPSSIVPLSMGELETVAKAEKNRATAGMLTISGTSQTSKVKIGGQLAVKLPKKMEASKKDVDTFVITSVTHEYDLKGEYRNSFTGIPSTVENIPMAPVYFPTALPQIATVKDNDDEKKLGRVKIEFQWQKSKGKTTNWIRVQTPDAGKSKKVPKNRGFVFIPEKDDIVMIGFEYGDPNRPYVTGSIFSEKVSSGGDTDNKKKSITTRVGSYIIFDDEKGNITIKDKDDSDSMIVLNGDKTISITATDKITLTAKEIIV
ncbi:MAG: phage baseplate assembly protein V, partial [Bacteroidales bacterium]|nr:phage baseplate assembly protein V [Bacteroidales bacterium]